MMRGVRSVAAIAGVLAVAALMVVGSNAIRSARPHTAEDACPVFVNPDGNVKWVPCSQVPSPTPAPVVIPSIRPCVPGEGQICAPSDPIAQPVPGQPASGHVDSGAAGTIQASCNIIFASPYATLIVYVADANGHIVEGASVSAHLVGPGAPSTVVSGTTTVGLATHNVHGMPSPDLLTLPLFAQDVAVGQAVTPSNYTQYACHGVASHNGATSNF